jgi:hypothetical protein
MSSVARLVALTTFASSVLACDAFSLQDVASPQDATACVPGASVCNCGPTAELVAKGPRGVTAFAVDATYAYWLASGMQYSARLDGNGGDGFALLDVVTPPPLADEVAVDSEYVYLVATGDGGAASVVRVPLTGGTPEPVVPRIPSVPVDLNASAGALYWTNATAQVCVAGVDGGEPSGDSGCGGGALFDPMASAIDGGDNHLVVFGGVAFLSVPSLSKIFSLPTDDAGAVTTYEEGGAAQLFAVSSTDVVYEDVYAAASGPGISIRGLATDLQTDVPSPIVSAVTALAADDTHVYFATRPPSPLNHAKPQAPPGPNSSRGIGSVSYPPQIWVASFPPIDAGATVQQQGATLVCETYVPLMLALDAQHVYWANENGEIKRAAINQMP